MAMTQEKKKALFSQYGRHAKDTGSPESQIAVLTDRINELTAHLKLHPKDFATRRGLMKMVGRRRRLQAYFRNAAAPERYKELIQKLNLRK
ncbi:MAG: 30S ribosomal protein S15 [Vampirovibrionales bacterium]|nr:30S ribosomal protein S15 [Vampirovibrionales bacterium]